MPCIFRKSSLQSTVFVVALTFLPAAQMRGAVNQWTTSGPYGGDITALAVDGMDSDLLYAGVRQVGGVFRSIDGGNQWVPANAGLPIDPSDLQVYSLAVDPINSGTVYLGLVYGVFVSTDGALTWNR